MVLLVKRLSGKVRTWVSYVRNANVTEHVMDNIMMVVIPRVLRSDVSERKEERKHRA